MPTPPKGKRLGSGPAHEKLMLANLATGLFEHGRITTTETKARRLRPYAERLITKARRGDLHARRQVLRLIRDKDVVHVLFTEIGPRFANRPGGYTRITKVGPRPGDNAPMAVIELVGEITEPAGGAARQQQAAAAPAAEEASADKAQAETEESNESASEEATAGAGTEQTDESASEEATAEAGTEETDESASEEATAEAESSDSEAEAGESAEDAAQPSSEEPDKT